MVVNFSTGAIGVPVAKRVAYLRALRPEVAALNMGSMNYAKYSRSRREFVFSFVFANPFDEIVALLEAMNELGIKPEHECFDLGHVGSLEPLVAQGRAARAAARRRASWACSAACRRPRATSPRWWTTSRPARTGA